MLRQRLLVILISLPLSIFFIVLGGWAFTLYITTILAAAAWELINIFSHGNYAPSRLVLIPGVIILSLSRYALGISNSIWILCLFILLAMLYHIIRYERGSETSAVDFMITTGGLVYLGWIGSYLISLRFINEGVWWLLLVIPAISLGDSGAFFIGRAFGRHKMAPRVSPKKSWEGYFGGVVSAILGGIALAAIWQMRAPSITLWSGAIIGAVIGTFAPLGDLGESLIKRQFGVKDSSNLLPGHGGVFDRIDSWLWAGVIGYYLVTWLW